MSLRKQSANAIKINLEALTETLEVIWRTNRIFSIPSSLSHIGGEQKDLLWCFGDCAGESKIVFLEMWLFLRSRIDWEMTLTSFKKTTKRFYEWDLTTIWYAEIYCISRDTRGVAEFYIMECEVRVVFVKILWVFVKDNYWWPS